MRNIIINKLINKCTVYHKQFMFKMIKYFNKKNNDLKNTVFKTLSVPNF